MSFHDKPGILLEGRALLKRLRKCAARRPFGGGLNGRALAAGAITLLRGASSKTEASAEARNPCTVSRKKNLGGV
jgi:hypothetical protein